MAFSVLLDSTTELSTNTKLELQDTGSGIRVVSMDFQPPPPKKVWASSQATVGSIPVAANYENRTIKLVVQVRGSESTMRAGVTAVTKKVGKLDRYGGTLTRTLNDGDLITFDLLGAEVEIPSDMEKWFHLRNYVELTVTLTAKPFGRGVKQYLKSDLTWTTVAGDQATISETSLPEIQVTFPAADGDVPALGELTIVEQDAENQGFFHWGIQCRNYVASTASTTSALAYQGEACFIYNSSAIATVSGASGGGSNNVLTQGTLSPTYVAMMGLPTAAGAYPTHTGEFAVWARVYPSNSGTVSLALEWSQADATVYTRNDPVTLPAAMSGSFRHVFLGMVNIAKVVTGTQRWDGRIIAKSTSLGDDLSIDRVYLFPTAEGYGEAYASNALPSATSASARSDFTTESGAIAGDSLAVGGTWTGAGDADDFSVAGGVATRTAVSDSGVTYPNARIITASTPTLTNAVVEVDCMASVAGGFIGLVARYVDVNNFFGAFLVTHASSTIVWVQGVIGGVHTYIGDTTILVKGRPSSTNTRLRLVVTATGAWAITAYEADSRGLLDEASGSYSQLATGGTLASGKVGLIDYWNTATASTRTYDNFIAYAGAPDSVPFASRNALVTSSAALRQDTGGTAYGKIADYRGPLFAIPAANTGSTCRLMVKASRTNYGADPAIDDIGLKLAHTPQYLQVPA